MQVKVSWPFVRAMQEVQKRSKKKVEFYFFSATHGVGLFSMCRDMGALLENVTIQEKQPYNEYMESLHQMDIVLFSFPFGGANSTYDAVTLGLPMVSLEGDEPHSRSDASIIRRAGLPESLIAKTEAEYVEIILGLLDDERRAEVAGRVRAVDLEGSFYAQDESDAFLNAFRSIYRDNTMERAA
jgi:predicted O-linked N-acetylglucosamine transferase (SPINDLY family)